MFCPVSVCPQPQSPLNPGKKALNPQPKALYLKPSSFQAFEEEKARKAAALERARRLLAVFASDVEARVWSFFEGGLGFTVFKGDSDVRVLHFVGLLWI